MQVVDRAVVGDVVANRGLDVRSAHTHDGLYVAPVQIAEEALMQVVDLDGTRQRSVAAIPQPG